VSGRTCCQHTCRHHYHFWLLPCRHSGSRVLSKMREPNDTLKKTMLCKFYATNRCSRGAFCRFAHGHSELRTLPRVSAAVRAHLHVSNQAGCQTHLSGQHGELDELVHLSMGSDSLQPRQQTVHALSDSHVRNASARQSVSEEAWGTQVQLREHFCIGGPLPCTGREHNQDMRPIMGSGQQMLPLERDARLRLEASSTATQDNCAQNRHTSSTQNTLALHTQTSLATCYDEVEEAERAPAASNNAARDSFNRVPQVHDSSWQHDASSWQQDGYCHQCGLSVCPGCPANCLICRFGAHL